MVGRKPARTPLIAALPMLLWFGCRGSSAPVKGNESTTNPVLYREPPPPVTYQEDPGNDAITPPGVVELGQQPRAIEVREGKPNSKKKKEKNKKNKKRKRSKKTKSSAEN